MTFGAVRKTVALAVHKFREIDGTQRAAAFAYYAFFSIFPLVVLFVTIASSVVDREVAARRVVAYFENFAPVAPEMRRQVFDTMTHLVKARARFSFVASVVLVWGALQFFKALIRATNRAWGAPMHNWWRMPLKSILLVGLLGTSVVLGISASLAKKHLRTTPELAGTAMAQVGPYVFSIISALILFYSLTLFYKLAPRRATRLSEVWLAAAGTTLLLRGLEFVFVFYLRNFSQLNAIYGAFGGLMALLLWIYFSGCIIVFGACLCAAQAEIEKR